MGIYTPAIHLRKTGFEDLTSLQLVSLMQVLGDCQARAERVNGYDVGRTHGLPKLIDDIDDIRTDLFVTLIHRLESVNTDVKVLANLPGREEWADIDGWSEAWLSAE